MFAGEDYVASENPVRFIDAFVEGSAPRADASKRSTQHKTDKFRLEAHWHPLEKAASPRQCRREGWPIITFPIVSISLQPKSVREGPTPLALLRGPGGVD
jgi:hypothetical protein